MLLAVGALAWSVLLLPAALLVPVYASQTTDWRGETVEGGRTLVEVNGASALIPVAVVVITAAVGAAALARRQWRPGAPARRVALGAASALVLLGAVGPASIGIFVLPAGIALGVGVSLSRLGAQSPPSAA